MHHDQMVTKLGFNRRAVLTNLKRQSGLHELSSKGIFKVSERNTAESSALFFITTIIRMLPGQSGKVGTILQLLVDFLCLLACLLIGKGFGRHLGVGRN